jgi:hypothetical protein
MIVGSSNLGGTVESPLERTSLKIQRLMFVKNNENRKGKG